MNPKTDIDAPTRAKLRTETADPNLAKSKTDSEKTDPRRAIPRSETAALIRK
jgi:hypothetical protein